MKYFLIAALAMFSLSTQARGTDCDYNTGGCVLQQHKELDIRTLIEEKTIAAARWGNGFLWNDAKPHSEVFKTDVLHPKAVEQKLAASFGIDCSKSYRWGCRINPR